RFQQGNGRLDDAVVDFARARSLAPDDAGLLLEEAELARRRDRLDDARRLLRDGITSHGDDARFALAVARLEQDLGRPDAALTVLRSAVQRSSSSREELSALLGEILFERNEADEARRLTAQLGRSTASPWVAYLEAYSQMQRGQWVRAARQLETLRVRLSGSPFWMARVQMALARCYR